MMRMHSECHLGDLCRSQSRCDCGEQLRNAKDAINEEGCGVVLYLRQEGRGVGLRDKMEVLELAEGRERGKWIGKKFDSETAMFAKGFDKAEYRQYNFAARMIRGLGIQNIALMTDNPQKVSSLRDLGLNVEQTKAAGKAVTIENLCELIWKSFNKYKIPFESMEMIEKEIQDLRDGKRIDDTLYQRLCICFQAIKSGDAPDSLPEELVALLKSVGDKLNQPK
jgi:GTP cyclohydrolase II